jgi:membrane protease YdiL (CAAX protease family)
MAEAPRDDGQGRFVLAAFAELSLGLLGVMLGWWLGPSPHNHIPRWWDLGGLSEGLILGGSLGAVLAAGILASSRLPLRGLHDLNQSMEHRFREFLSQMSYLELGVLSMTAGLGEEILFRGWLQQGLMGILDAQANPWLIGLALIIASILFGLAHPISPLYILLAAAMGLFLGGIYVLTENLLCAIVAHAVYDAVILWKWKRDMDLENAMEV